MDAMVKSIRRILLVMGIFALFASCAGGEYPEATDPYVNDFANLLSVSDVADIHAMFQTMRQEHGIHAVVVTISSFQAYTVNARTFEEFATNLFNVWGIGNAQKHNGVLLLVARDDRNVRIEVGAGYEKNLNSAMKALIDDHIIPAFKRDEYSRGIRAGAQALVDQLTGYENGSNQKLNPSDVFFVALAVAFLVGAVWLIWPRQRKPGRHASRARPFHTRHGLLWSNHESSSDHGNSFDGGHSSGGGASGEW